MTSPLAGPSSSLVTAHRRKDAALTRVAAQWDDAAFRQLDQRVLRPLADATNRFTAAVQHLDVALGRALNDLSR